MREQVPYGEDRAVLIGLRGICFMGHGHTSHGACISLGMHLMGMHLTGGTAQKVDTNELDNRCCEWAALRRQSTSAVQGTNEGGFQLGSYQLNDTARAGYSAD